MSVLAFAVAAYLLGSLPSSHLAGRAAGVDLSRHGSGNLGGTNVFRVLGWRYAIPVVAADVAKGFLPVWFFPLWDGRHLPHLALLYGLCAIVGHIWSVFVGFRGGKGVATSGGVLFALVPVATVIGLLVWGGLALLTRTISIASLSAATVLPAAAYLLEAPPARVILTVVLAVLVWWTHRDNIVRLSRGRELRFGEGVSGAPPGDEPAEPAADDEARGRRGRGPA